MKIRTLHKNHNAVKLFKLNCVIDCTSFYEYANLKDYLENKLGYTLRFPQCRAQKFQPAWTYKSEGSPSRMVRQIFLKDEATATFILMGFQLEPIF